MSLGLEENTLELWRACGYAYLQGKLLFAAASNGGIRGGITFPARDIHTCINACDGNGRKAPFTPLRRPDYSNFSILGTSVQGAWPAFKHLGPLNERKEGLVLGENKPFEGMTMKCMSGTFVATPIAAALVANILAYVSANAVLFGSSIDQTRNQVKSPEDVRKILKAMSRESDTYDVITPWYGNGGRFHDYDKETNFAEAIKISLREREY